VDREFKVIRKPRQFVDEVASRQGHFSPLIIGITAPSSGGKTYSGLRLAKGIQRVVGGEIFGIDTEEGRMLHYSDYFKFRHVPMTAPFSPLDYLDAIDHCASRGAKIVIIDQLSNEHDGEGGVLDQIDDFLERKCGEDFDKRNKFLLLAQVQPKKARKHLNRHIVSLAGKIVFILCYRAEEKIKPKKGGGEPDKLGWQPITTSKLPYDMTVRFLLPPGSDGVPTLIPAEPSERLVIKNPEQFKGWFKPGEALSEDMGQKLAEWAAGGQGAPQSTQERPQAEPRRRPQTAEEWLSATRKCGTIADLEKIKTVCQNAYPQGMPLEIDDAFTLRREYLLEQEGKQL
jgi:hypothetical protein